MDVQMPDGTIVKDVPEGTTKAELTSLLESNGMSQEPEKGFFERSMETLGNAVTRAGEAATGDSRITSGDSNYQAAEEAFGPAKKSLPERVSGGIGSLFSGAGQVAMDAAIQGGKAVLPKDAEEGIAGVAQGVAESAPVQAAGKAWGAFEEAAPEFAEGVASGAEFGAGLLPRKGYVHSNTKRVGQKYLGSGGKGERRRAVETMFEPDLGKGRGDYSIQGKLGRKTYSPDPSEVEMFNDIEKVPGLKPTKSHTEAVSALEKEVDRLRTGLDKDVSGVSVSLDDILDDLSRAQDEAAKSPFLTGDAGKSAERVMDMFVEELTKVARPDGTVDAKDLLQARRNLDSALKAQSRTLFDPSRSSATQLAAQSIRQSINDRVGAAVPSAKVKDSLKRQSNLLKGRDTIMPRMYSEAQTSIFRYIEGVERRTGISHPTTPLAMGATAHSPVGIGVTAGALVFDSVGRLSQGSRLAAIKALGVIDTIINKGGKAAQQASLDKAAILALIAEDDRLKKENK